MWWKTLIREPNHGERFLPLLLIGGLAAYLLIFWYIGKENHAAELARKEELLWEKKQDSIRKADSAIIKSFPADLSTASDPSRSGPGRTPVAGQVALNIHYLIIAGSFSTGANAQSVAAAYMRLGFEASVVQRKNPDGSVSHLVSLKSFGNHEEASDFRNEVKKNNRINTWIYISQP